MKKLFRLATLVKLIALRGKFRSSGDDYSKQRSESLADLKQFCPLPARKDPDKSSFRQWIQKNHYLKGWIGQVSFIKNAMRSKARHLWVPDLSLCYIRNPRVASTSLSFAMLQKQYVQLKHLNIPDEKINFLTDVNLRYRVNAMEKQAVFFTVVRNPFSRIVSVYREFFEHGGGGSGFIYEDYLFGIFTKDLSFNEFVQRLRLIPDTLKDQHIKPQNALLRYYQKKKIPVQIFKLEEPLELNRFLSRFRMRLASDHPQTAYNYRQYYDRESLEIVHGLYSRDITFFGYEQAYEDLRAFVLMHPSRISF